MAHALVPMPPKNTIHQANVVLGSITDEMESRVCPLQRANKVTNFNFLVEDVLVLPLVEIIEERGTILLPEVPRRRCHRCVPSVACRMKLTQNSSTTRVTLFIQDNTNRLPLIGLKTFKVDNHILFTHVRSGIWDPIVCTHVKQTRTRNFPFYLPTIRLYVPRNEPSNRVFHSIPDDFGFYDARIKHGCIIETCHQIALDAYESRT